MSFWKEESGGLEINWHEKLTTPLKPPTRQGFGMTLVERLVPHECNGICDIQFTTSGLEVRFWLPNDAVGTGGEFVKSVEPNYYPPAPTLSPETKDSKIIVVEDNTLLALEMESLLVSAGYNKVMLFNSIASCRNKIFEEPSQLPDIAILDINLGEMTSFSLGEELKEKGVSLIIASGYDEGLEIPDSLAEVPRLRKPIDDHKLLQLLITAEGSRK